MSADEGLQIGRRVKARRIAAYLREMGVTTQILAAHEGGTDEWWLLADNQSRQFPKVAATKRTVPPSAETRALVLEYLARDAWPRDEDVP